MATPIDAVLCNAMVAPGVRCGHRVEEHILHGSTVLECWQCEDWHGFILRDPRPRAAH